MKFSKTACGRLLDLVQVQVEAQPQWTTFSNHTVGLCDIEYTGILNVKRDTKRCT